MLTPAGAFTDLHDFDETDGRSPSGLVQATDGNFYGVTSGGGTDGFGTVFKITPAGKLTTLHNFDNTDGWVAQGSGLIQAANGNFYGTTFYGGANGEGTVFEITPSGSFTSLYSFPTNSACPYCTGPNGLTQGVDGNICLLYTSPG